MSSNTKTDTNLEVKKEPPVQSEMDIENENKKAMQVMVTEGPDAAAKHMMQMAGGDYSRMRMMYG